MVEETGVPGENHQPVAVTDNLFKLYNCARYDKDYGSVVHMQMCHS
jgi:hypothetical protein